MLCKTQVTALIYITLLANKWLYESQRHIRQTQGEAEGIYRIVFTAAPETSQNPAGEAISNHGRCSNASTREVGV